MKLTGKTSVRGFRMSGWDARFGAEGVLHVPRVSGPMGRGVNLSVQAAGLTFCLLLSQDEPLLQG